MFFQNKPSSILRSDKHKAINAIGELAFGLNAQFFIKKNIVSIGLGHAQQSYTMSNDDPFISQLLFWWWLGCDGCEFYKIHYKNRYITVPISYSRILYNKGKSRYLFYATAEFSNEFRYDADIAVEYYEPAPENDDAFKAMISSYQSKRHQLRWRVGLGFKWRAIVPDTFGFNLRIMLQTVTTSINDEFLGQPYGIAVQFGMQYNFAPSKT
jgi:hypothetical protein